MNPRPAEFVSTEGDLEGANYSNEDGAMDYRVSIQREVISAVFNDETLERLRQARVLPVAAFTDPLCAGIWKNFLHNIEGLDISEALGNLHGDPEEIDRILDWKHEGKNFSGNLRELRAACIANGWVEWPQTTRAVDLCACPPSTPDMLIKGILYRGGTMMISGPSKSHKTFTMMAAACAVSAGLPWLGFETMRTPVLYLNLELQDFAAESRIRTICDKLGIRPTIDLRLWNLRGQRVTLDELKIRLPPEIRRFGIGLVFIDPHYKVSAVSGGEENSNDSQGLLLSGLEDICAANGAALVISHHFAKGNASLKNAIDRASGGGVFARWGDVIMTFTPHATTGAMTAELSLRNFAPVAPFTMRWSFPLWIPATDLDPTKLKRSGASETQASEKALDALGSATLTFSEWHKATGLPDTTFRRKRDILIKDGTVEKVGDCYRKVKPGSDQLP